jgi:hypothetical protein
MAWPDSNRPGEPGDARPWHWVARAEDGAGTPLPIGWNGALRQWMVWDGSNVGPEEAARRFTYLGPALTPAETAARLAEAEAGRAPEPLRGLAALAASAQPPPPDHLVRRKDAVRNHILIFAGTLFGTLWLAEMVGLIK